MESTAHILAPKDSHLHCFEEQSFRPLPVQAGELRNKLETAESQCAALAEAQAVAVAEVEQLQTARKEVGRHGRLASQGSSQPALATAVHEQLPGCMRACCSLCSPRTHALLVPFGCPRPPQAEAAKTTVRLALEKVKTLQDDLSAKAQVGGSR